MASVSGTHVRVFVVLVVEDDPDLRELFGLALRKAGFLVQEAATLAEGAALIRKKAPDLVLLDRDLPDGDGFDIARALRGTVPTLAVTARDDLGVRRAAREAGCQSFLAKPCTPAALIGRVCELLELALPPNLAFAGLRAHS